jgi:hypothetical protein
LAGTHDGEGFFQIGSEELGIFIGERGIVSRKPHGRVHGHQGGYRYGWGRQGAARRRGGRAAGKATEEVFEHAGGLLSSGDPSGAQQYGADMK